MTSPMQPSGISVLHHCPAVMGSAGGGMYSVLKLNKVDILLSALNYILLLLFNVTSRKSKPDKS